MSKDDILSKLEEELRRRYGEGSLEDLLKRLRGDNDDSEKKKPIGIRRCNSMGDLGRAEKEEDERRVHTEPLDPESKKKYENMPNPFQKSTYPDNVIAEPYRTQRPKMDPSRLRVIATQTGEWLEERKGKKLYEKEQKDEEFEGRRNKNKMRGRKDKYYEQVDDEDQNFAEDTLGHLIDEDEEDNGENDLLGKIEEESQNIEEEEKKENYEEQIQEKEIEQNISPQVDEIQEDILLQEKLKQQQEIERQELIEKQRVEEQEALLRKLQIERENKELEEQILLQQQQQQRQQQLLLQQQLEQERIQKLEEEKAQLLEQERLLELERQKKIQEQLEIDKQKEQERLNSLREMEQMVDQTINEEKEESDSDDDNLEKRIKDMSDPDKRKFNVNDILGDFDRDERGNLVMLQNKTGDSIDKLGNRVNEKGYLIDQKTGDVLEKESKSKVFDRNDLDDRGEIPPPFNVEKYNFNPHDVRGYFDRDPKTGQELITANKNKNGQYIDKMGRIVNQYGYLIDNDGNIIDKRGRLRVNRKQLEDGGNMPLLFNYKAKKFELRDVIGDFDKDRKGNIIVRRDKDNQMVDKNNRKVNNKGYLIDNDGNVINKEGKIIFESNQLSKDNEIPKLFPFIKFNIDDIKGDFEMDPLGNPMLQKDRNGNKIDNKGRQVNDKGYLIDSQGNVKNQRGYKVFGKNLMLQDGEIPKVFRTGLFRKDTVDSFSQLMSEIEDLEKMHDIEEAKMQSQRRKQNYIDDDENERIAKRIDQIVEEDNDDDDLLMKELEDLANGGHDNRPPSIGGNTSFDSMMEDTPSNYNAANQRFNEQEQMRQRVRQATKGNNQQVISEDIDVESEFQGQGKRLKKKKKKKVKKQKEVDPDERELLMAKAYGAMSSQQVDKLIQDKRRKDATMLSQLQQQQQHMQNKTSQIFKNADQLSRVSSVNQKKRIQGHNQGTLSTQRIGVPNDSIKKNGYMHQTQSSFKEQTPSQNSKRPPRVRTDHQLHKRNDSKKEREYNLNHIANSVSGFYRGGDSASDNSKLNNESNYAQDIGRIQRQINNSSLDHHDVQRKNSDIKAKKNTIDDPELDQIYKTAKVFADISQLSDWEKDSLLSGNSDISHFTGLFQNPVSSTKVRGLESIYLQRLEPASKGNRQTSMLRKGGKKINKDESKAKFRVMHHRLHDEPEWYVDENRELGSVLSDNMKVIERKYKEEFASGSGSGKKKFMNQEGRNIFTGNLNQYKDMKAQEKVKNAIDLAQ